MPTDAHEAIRAALAEVVHEHCLGDVLHDPQIEDLLSDLTARGLDAIPPGVLAQLALERGGLEQVGCWWWHSVYEGDIVIMDRPPYDRETEHWPVYRLSPGVSSDAEAPPQEGDDERDLRFAPENDRIWGPGNWVRCPTCPPDAAGRSPYHHKDAHATPDAEATTVAPPAPTQAPAFVQQAAIDKLAALEPNWDSYHANPPTEQALDVLRHLQVVPCTDGGVQVDIYANGWETELTFSPAGRPTCFISEQATAAAPSPAVTPETAWSVDTVCGWFVVLPGGYDQREPDCAADPAGGATTQEAGG